MNATQSMTTINKLEQFLYEPLVYGKINIIAWWGGGKEIDYRCLHEWP